MHLSIEQMRLVISPQVFCLDTLCKQKLYPERSFSSYHRKGMEAQGPTGRGGGAVFHTLVPI